MFTSKRIAAVLGVAALMVAIWLMLGPQVLARVAYMGYRDSTFEYRLMIDDYYDLEQKQTVEGGVLVTIHPDRPFADAPGFSEAYIRATNARARQWMTERQDGTLIDVMLVFSRPLTLEEANALLSAHSASVFESGVVGYTGETPWAAYSVESGPLLSQSLEEVAYAQGFGFEASTIAIGYLAVRAWVPAQQLQSLIEHPDIRLLDTTPQHVRELVSLNPQWEGKEITHLAIEMPVWAYEWK